MRTLIFIILFSVGLSAQYTTATFTPTTPIVLSDGRLYAEVIFTGSSGENPTQQQFYAISSDDLKQQVNNYLLSLNTTLSAKIALPQGSVIGSPTVIVIPPLTAEQQFFIDLSQLYALNAAIASGVFLATDLNYIALKTKTLSEFKTSYINDSGWPR